jgi:O-antigen ligase
LTLYRWLPNWGVLALLIGGALVTSVGCVYAPTKVLAAALALGFLGLCTRYPAFGVGLLFSLFLIEGSPAYASVTGVLHVGTPSDLLVAYILVLTLGRLAGTHERLFKSVRTARSAGAAVIVVAVFFLWLIVSFSWSPAPLSQIASTLRVLVQAPIIVLIGILVLRTRRDLNIAASTYAAGAALLALYVFFHYQSLGGSSALVAYRGDVTAFKSNSNEISVSLAAAPAIGAIAFARLRNGLRVPLLCGLIGIIAIALIILTSRGALIATGAGLLAVFITSRDLRSRVGGIAALIAGVAVYQVMVITNTLPPYFIDRFQQASSDNFGHRGPGWEYGLSLFAHHPLFGVGELGFQTLLGRTGLSFYSGVTAPHSDYVGTLSNGGIIGILLFLLMLLVLGRIIIPGSGWSVPGIYLFVLLVVASGSGDFFTYTHWLWAVMTFALCLALTSREAAEERLHQNVDSGEGTRALPALPVAFSPRAVPAVGRVAGPH